jgi:two-component system, cell cycle sensor histidine kinase and response regulator CckA
MGPQMETILVVDDEAQVRTLARDILLGAGYQVLEAEDGDQALRIADDHQGAIHVLLTDIMMPGINGKELADRFLVGRPDTKPIFMSGRAAEVISDAGVLIPVDAFLAKPFTVERLLNKVRERLEYRSPFSRPR